jgi:microcystin-dependent protein
MANYTKINNFTAKDSLATGNVNKRVRGSEFDAEFNAISAAIATKPDFSFVSGMIIMWSGSIASIPSGWLLCDGSSGTPDLRNRFVVGAGSTYAVNATGGSADATLVSHTHTATVTDPGHLHSFTRHTSNGTSSNSALGNGDGNGSSVTQNTSSTTTGITVSNSTEGSSATNANLPPYYALAYIMKT